MSHRMCINVNGVVCDQDYMYTSYIKKKEEGHCLWVQRAHAGTFAYHILRVHLFGCELGDSLQCHGVSVRLVNLRNCVAGR